MYIMFLLFLIALYLGCTLFVGPAVAYVICTGFCILSGILLIGWAFSLAFQSIGMAAESSYWCAAISIFAIIALWIFFKWYYAHKKNGLRKMRMEEAAEASPCDEPIFLDFTFGMNEKEVNEHFQQLQTSNRIEYFGGFYFYPWIYAPLEKSIREEYKGEIKPHFHDDSLYRINITFPITNDWHYSSFELDIYAALKKKGYNIFKSVSPEKYYFIKQNIAVSFRKKHIDNWEGIEVEYLDARVDKAKKLQEEEEQKKEEERRRQEEARKQAHSDF